MRPPCDGRSDLFYSESAAKIRAAKALCASCPHRAECAELGRNEPYGIWGGLTEEERRRQRSTSARLRSRAVRLAEMGWTTKGIARHLNVTERQVSRWRHEAGRGQEVAA